MRLIDADALEYTRVRIFHGINEDGTPCVGGYNAVVMSCAIEDDPTVDAVTVVRCKDCKHLRAHKRCYTCPKRVGAMWEEDLMGYCSNAERKETNEGL